MLNPPPHLSGDGILVGYSLEHERHTAPIGFVYGDGDRRIGPESGFLTPILHTGGGHLLTIAPTGAGKGVSCIIPTLLRFPGPVIVIDPKGENYAVTGARRRALGQEVVLLDPMGITGAAEAGALNPLDLIDADGAQAIDDSSMLASLLSGGVEKDDPRNLFWYQRGEQLLTGLIQYVATEADEGERNLSEVRKILNLPGDDFIEFSRNRLAVADDPDVRQIAGTLINPAQEMIGSILGMAQNSLGFLRGDLLHRSTARSSFALEGITAGDPLSIFLVIPPDKLQSHRNLLRVWIGTLMAALMRRRAPMRHNTLFILDEAAQLGPLEQLRQAITLLRGYGLQTWSFWQDHSQLSNLYPLDWQTMYNNCRVHQAFGFTTLQAANAISGLSGFHDPLEALRLDSDEMLLSISGDEAVIAQKPNYLTDPAFQGLFSENPFYRQSPQRPPAAQREQRRYRRPGGAGREETGEGGDREEPGTGPSSEGPGAGRRGETGPREEGVVAAAVDGSEPREAEDRGLDAEELDDVLKRLGVRMGEAGGGEEAGSGESPGGEEARDPFGPPAVRELEAAPRLPPGGLTPLPLARPLNAGQIPLLLESVERGLGVEWDSYGTVVRVDHVPFYGRYYLCELTDPGRKPARAMCVLQGNDVRAFHGGEREILELTRDAGLTWSPLAAALYLQFHLHFTRGREATVRLASTLEELAYWWGAAPGSLDHLRDVLSDPAGTLLDDGTVEVVGSGVAGGDLCTIRGRVTPDGGVHDLRVEPVHRGVGPAPAVDPEVAGVAGLAGIHGPWEEVSGVDREGLLPFLTWSEWEAVEEGGPILRRPISCYRGLDLVRLPPGQPSGLPTLLLWGGGSPWRVSFATRSTLNARLLEIRNPEDAEACLRLYTWLRSGPDYPITILNRPEDLEALILPGARGVEDPVEPLREGWIPFTVEPRDDGSHAARFTMLEGAKVLEMQVVLGSNGELVEASERVLAEGLPVDAHVLTLCLAYPPFGQATP